MGKGGLKRKAVGDHKPQRSQRIAEASRERASDAPRFPLRNVNSSGVERSDKKHGRANAARTGLHAKRVHQAQIKLRFEKSSSGVRSDKIKRPGGGVDRVFKSVQHLDGSIRQIALLLLW